MATIIDGKAVAARRARGGRRGGGRHRGARRRGARPRDGAGGRRPGVAHLRGRQAPGVRGGRDRARSVTTSRPTPPRTTLLDLVAELNSDPAVSGIIVQLPLPGAHRRGARDRRGRPGKDVDGLTPTNAGLLVQGRDALVPATPSGVMELLRVYDTPLEGAERGRRRPQRPRRQAGRLAAAARNATVTVCHSRTRDLAAVCRRADVLVAAVGSPRLITGDMVKPGATVIDVGMNRTEDGLVGDVDFDSARRARPRDHAGPGRGRPDDDRDAAREHPARPPADAGVRAVRCRTSCVMP